MVLYRLLDLGSEVLAIRCGGKHDDDAISLIETQLNDRIQTFVRLFRAVYASHELETAVGTSLVKLLDNHDRNG